MKTKPVSFWNVTLLTLLLVGPLPTNALRSVHAQTLTMGQIKSNLWSNPPGLGDPLVREASLLAFDAWLIPSAIPDAIQFYQDQVGKVASEIQGDAPVGATVWMMYNHGFIIKTPGAVFAFDLISSSPGAAVSLSDDIVKQIDVFFVSHNHTDHYDRVLASRVIANNGIVVGPSEMFGTGQGYIGMAAGESRSISNLQVTARYGEHNVPVRMFEVTCPNGLKFLHTGDNQASWNLPTLNGCVLLLNSWVNESGSTSAAVGMRNSLQKVQPLLMIPGHIQELGHPYSPGDPAGRMIYAWVFEVDDQPIASPMQVMTWGERYDVLLSALPGAETPVQPASRTNAVGSTATFSVTATGPAPFAYQWLKSGVNLSDGGNISGAETSTLMLSDVVQADAGGYSVIISNASGSVTSLVATLTVVNPLITSQPVSQIANAGVTVGLSVTAGGTAPLGYQWRKDGTAVAGATAASLTLTNVQPVDAGGYDVVVSNEFGTVTSTVARLTVNLATVDPSFNPAAGSSVYSLAVQPDGKILVGGTFTSLGGQSRNCLGRLNADGTLDTGFNPGASDSGAVYSLALQADGNILVGGYFTTLGGQLRKGIGRLNSEGTLDSGFNPGTDGLVYSLVVQADGKFVVVGRFSLLAGQTRYFIGRLHANGTLDADFNPAAGGGYVSSMNTLAVQPDGKILVGGDFGTPGADGSWRTNIARLNPNGTMESGFNPGASDAVLSLAVQPDGKILVGGNFTTLAGQARNRLGRLNSDGTLDPVFNPAANNSVSSLAVQADGKILVGGTFTTLGGQPRNGIGRLNGNGTLDATFNPGAGAVSSLAVQADGKILVGGGFSTLGGQLRNSIGQLNNTDPATQSLSCDGTDITWLRGGTSPEVWRTLFDCSSIGTNWLSLGSGTRIAGGWRLTGVSVPAGANLRARGFLTGGQYNGSSWFVETSIVTSPPFALSQPAGRTNNVGTDATFSVVAGGTPTLNYQWRKDGDNIAGATGSSLTLNNVQESDQGIYSVVVSNAFGSVTSSPALLTVNQAPIADASATQPLVIWANGTNATVILNGTRSSDPDGDQILGWHWAVDAAPPNAAYWLNFDNFPAADFSANTPGTYVLSLVASDGMAWSAPDTVTITVRDNQPPVAIATADKTAGPAPLTVCFDGSQSYDPETKPLTYVWDFGDGSPQFIGVSVTNTFVSIGIFRVTLVVTDERGARDLNEVAITVRDTDGPLITTPGSVAAEATGPDGGIVRFQVTASDAVSGPAPVTCVPASGGLFPIGTTMVICKAKDAAGNESQATFPVMVNQPATIPDPWIGMYDLGNLGDAWAGAHAINSHRQVVGLSSVPHPQFPVPEVPNGMHLRAFLWSPILGMTDLGTLGGHQGWAHGINDQGVIVGEDMDLAGNRRGFKIVPLDADSDGVPDTWFRDANADGVNDLMTVLAHDSDSCKAYDVNAVGQVAGAFQDAGAVWHAVIWQTDKTCLDLGMVVGANNPVGINDAGWVTADQALSDGVNPAIALPGFAFDLSDAGTVLLRTPTASGPDGAVWQGGAVTASFNRPGQQVTLPRTLNNDEQVAGILDFGGAPAFIWTAKGGFLELPSPGGPYDPTKYGPQVGAYDIHADGLWVVGFAQRVRLPRGFDGLATLWTLPPNTPQGREVEVLRVLVKVAVKYESVVKEGVTVAIKVAEAEDPGAKPPGYKAVSDYVDISTTALFDKKVEVKIAYEVALVTDPEQVRMLHKDNDGQWQDVTKDVDIVAQTVTGEVDSFSWFVLAQPEDQTGSQVSIVSMPAVVQAGLPFTLLAQADDTATGNSGIASAEYSLDDGVTWNAMVASDGSFGAPLETVQAALLNGLPVGVYRVLVRATESAGNAGMSETMMLAVYDPTGGFVTGGGWINSPAGAFNPGLEEFAGVVGKANFGFVSKYQKGANVPTGNTEFQFKAGNLNFKSRAYQWLVVAGAKAQYKGWGTINGEGNYAFMLTAIDGQVSGGGGADRFRIKLWDEASGTKVYDNQHGTDDSAGLTKDGTLLQGGSIVIHKK